MILFHQTHDGCAVARLATAQGYLGALYKLHVRRLFFDVIVLSVSFPSAPSFRISMSHKSSSSNNELSHNNSPSQSHGRVTSSSRHADSSGYESQLNSNPVIVSLAPPPSGHGSNSRSQPVASSTGPPRYSTTSTSGAPPHPPSTRARFFIASSREPSPPRRVVGPPTPSPTRSLHSSQGEPAMFPLDSGSRNSSRPPSSNRSSYYLGSTGSYGSNYQGSGGSDDANRSSSASAIPSRNWRLHSPSPSPQGSQPQPLLLPPQQHILGFGDGRSSSDEHAGQSRTTAQFLRGRGRGAPHGNYPCGSSRRS